MGDFLFRNFVVPDLIIEAEPEVLITDFLCTFYPEQPPVTKTKDPGTSNAGGT